MFIYLGIIIIGLLIDQISKYYAITKLAPVASMPIIKNVFHLTYAENTGAAFSIFTNQQGFLIAVSVIFILLLLGVFIVIPKKKYVMLNIAVSMIISGAAGNLIDRVRFHYVIDFFDFRLIHFAIFNVADSLVVCGCILMIIAILCNQAPTDWSELNFIRKKNNDQKHA